MAQPSPVPELHRLQSAARVALGSTLVGAGISHLTVARRDVRAQVLDFVPLDTDTTVLASGTVGLPRPSRI